MSLAPLISSAVASSATASDLLAVAKAVLAIAKPGIDLAKDQLLNGDKYAAQRSLSLTGYTKQTNLRSRLYIDESLRDEEVLPHLAKALHSMYVGLIINALQLTQLVTAGKTVQDYISTIATEAFGEYHDVMGDLAALSASLEAQQPQQYAPTHKYSVDEVKTEMERRRMDDLKTLGRKKAEGPPDLAVNQVTVAPPDIVPVGKLIEVTLTNPENPDASAKVTLGVQMVPYFIPARLASAFINKDTSLGFLRRLTQWRAGEITFWRDLIFQLDRINKAYAISRNDPNKVFYEFMSQVSKKDRAAITQNLAKPDAINRSHNLANSVMIFSTEAVAQAKIESGIDLHDRAARNRYFTDTYAMAIVVVDPMYRQATLYLNGIDDVGTYGFSQFEHKSKDKDGVDFLKMLAVLQVGKAPRF